MKVFVTLILLLAVCAGKRLLSSEELEPFMFTEQITGDRQILQPTKLSERYGYKFPVETYEIAMVNYKHQFLPKQFPKTPIFAYAGKNKKGNYEPSYPGPSILGFMGTPVEIVWTNMITGKPFLPLELNPPFDMIKPFVDEVPVVPHVHGLENQFQSDGQPLSFWTASGRQGELFNSLKSKRNQNQAVYRYINTKEGLFWYHDHTIGMTRLNTYAGLAGGYEIVDPHVSEEERNVMRIYGDLPRKFFVISDKSFYDNGELYYPTESPFSDFTTWVPQFFGNTMLVNGKIWPKITLEQQIYRFAFLNACQSRFLNMRFQHNGVPLPFKLFRRDADFLRKAVTQKEHFLIISGRIEIIIDLTDIQGEIIVTNDAAFPFPVGDSPDRFTGKIFKIVVKGSKGKRRNLQLSNPLNLQINGFNYGSNSDFVSEFRQSLMTDIKQRLNVLNPSLTPYSSYYPSDNEYNSWPFIDSDPSQFFNEKFNFGSNLAGLPFSLSNPGQKEENFVIKNTTYPRFSEGMPYFTVLTNVQNAAGETSGIMIDAVSMELGRNCTGGTFKLGQTYDFYIINLTEDEHPMHIHLVNFQVIGRFDFDTAAYRQAWEKKNGKPGPRGFSRVPEQVDARPFRTSPIQPPGVDEQIFMDVISVPVNKVTIARVKMSDQKGRNFPFDARGSRYVWHCHILEHEDNEMMRWFCLQ